MNWIKFYSIITIFCLAAAFIFLLLYANYELFAIWGYIALGFGVVGFVSGIILITKKRIKKKEDLY